MTTDDLIREAEREADRAMVEAARRVVYPPIPAFPGTKRTALDAMLAVRRQIKTPETWQTAPIWVENAPGDYAGEEPFTN